MAIRSAEAVWEGNLKDGKGNIKTQSGAYNGGYSFSSRFEDGAGTNPEELVAAAHAGCFSMAFAHGLSEAGHPPTRVHTTAKVHLQKDAGGFSIPKIDLVTEVEVPGIDDAKLKEEGDKAKKNCPLSKLLAAAEITLDLKRVGTK
jgi:osmotically inducible protein OsmC